jgi:hypothetical protein
MNIELTKREIIELQFALIQAEKNPSSYGCDILSKKIIEDLKEKLLLVEKAYNNK